LKIEELPLKGVKMGKRLLAFVILLVMALTITSGAESITIEQYAKSIEDTMYEGAPEGMEISVTYKKSSQMLILQLYDEALSYKNYGYTHDPANLTILTTVLESIKSDVSNVFPGVNVCIVSGGSSDDITILMFESLGMLFIVDNVKKSVVHVETRTDIRSIVNQP
jgi:hypothetical protein